MQIIRPAQVIQKVGLSRTTIWRLENAGTFPKRVQLSVRTVGYYAAEIELWLAERQLVDR